MKVAILGATSFIGLNLIQYGYTHNWEIISIIRKNAPKRHLIEDPYPNVKIIECNMDDYDKIDEKIDDIDCGVYLTWNGTRGASRNDVELQRYNFEIGCAALKSIAKTNCKKIVTAGSQAEYGPWFHEDKLRETDIPHPNTEYGKFKLKYYEFAKTFCDEQGIQLIEPRFFSLYGPHDFEGTMIISMLKKMLQGEPCDLTKCIQKWDFLYITDAIDALAKLIEENHESGVYNFGSGVCHPLKRFVEEMYRITKSHSQLNYGAVPYPDTGIVNVNPNVEKLISIGWQPKVTFEEGIKNIIRTFNRP